jgi:hypothetical protein
MADPVTLRALRELNKLISNSDDAKYADLNRVISAFAAVPGRTVEQKIKAVNADWKRKAIKPKSHNALRTLVKDASDLFAVTGPKTIQNDLGKMKGFLSGGETTSAEEFTGYLKIEPAPAKPKTGRTTPRHLDAVKFGDELIRGLESKAEFDALVAQLIAPRTYSIAQINEVTRHFLGYATNFNSKVKAAEALKQRQSDMAIGGAQIKQIEGLRV